MRSCATGAGGGGGGGGGGVWHAASAAIAAATPIIRIGAPLFVTIMWSFLCVPRQESNGMTQRVLPFPESRLSPLPGKENARSAIGAPGIDKPSQTCGDPRIYRIGRFIPRSFAAAEEAQQVLEHDHEIQIQGCRAHDYHLVGKFSAAIICIAVLQLLRVISCQTCKDQYT